MEEDRESVESVADDKVDDILEDEDVSSEYLPETTKKRIRKRKKSSRKKKAQESSSDSSSSDSSREESEEGRKRKQAGKKQSSSQRYCSPRKSIYNDEEDPEKEALKTFEQDLMDCQSVDDLRKCFNSLAAKDFPNLTGTVWTRIRSQACGNKDSRYAYAKIKDKPQKIEEVWAKVMEVTNWNKFTAGCLASKSKLKKIRVSSDYDPTINFDQASINLACMAKCITEERIRTSLSLIHGNIDHAVDTLTNIGGREHKQALWEELLILCNEYVKTIPSENSYRYSYPELAELKPR